jgi:hypothetical protein
MPTAQAKRLPTATGRPHRWRMAYAGSKRTSPVRVRRCVLKRAIMLARWHADKEIEAKRACKGSERGMQGT